MNRKGVIFDFNGTLFFDSPLHVIAWDSISMELSGTHVTAKRLIEEFSGLPNLEILKKIAGPDHSPDFYDAYSRKKEALYRKAVEEIPGGAHLTDGAEALFAMLQKENIPFTIASASIKENIDFFVRVFHLDRWLDPESIVYDDGSYSDKIGMFKEAEKRLQIDGSILIFEDSYSGIACAAGLPNVSLIVIDDPNLHNVYAQFPCILCRIHDFNDAIDETASWIQC